MYTARTFDRPGEAVPCMECPLRRLPLFRKNTSEEIAFIASMRTDQIALSAGQTILQEGANDPPLYSLFSGWAIRYKTLPDDRRQILNFLLPGDVIGFQANMLGEVAHGVEALTDVVLCRHSRAKIWDLYKGHPELAFDATWLTAKEESLVDEALLSIGRRSASQRIAMLLIHLYRRASAYLPFHAAEAGVSLPVTQQQLADALGLSLVHTNKTLRRLRKAGYFHFVGQTLHMDDLAGLEELAEYHEGRQRPRPLL